MTYTTIMLWNLNYEWITVYIDGYFCKWMNAQLCELIENCVD